MFGTVFTLAYRIFRVCSSLTKLHTELVCRKLIVLKNGYPETFINKCFNILMDNIHVVKESTLTACPGPSIPYSNTLTN